MVFASSFRCSSAGCGWWDAWQPWDFPQLLACLPEEAAFLLLFPGTSHQTRHLPDSRRASKAKGTLGGLKLFKGMTPASPRVTACKTLMWGGKMHICIKAVYQSFKLFRFFLVCWKKNKREGGLQTVCQRLERKHLVYPGVVIVKLSDT